MLLLGGGAPDRVLVYAFSGQSESENYIVEVIDDSTFLITRLDVLSKNEHFPFVANHGGEIIAYERGDPGVVRLLPPFEDISQRIPWPDFDEEENEDERPGYSACYLDLVHILMASQEGRLFVLHTRSMEIIGEVIVEGFEPFPSSKKYPTIDPPGISSNLAAFQSCGDDVIAFFAENHLDSNAKMVIIPIGEILTG